MKTLGLNKRSTYKGFIYPHPGQFQLKGSEWEERAQKIVADGGRIDRDSDGALAVYNNQAQRQFEVYPS